MDERIVTEAEARYLEEIQADCATLLGPDIEVAELTMCREGGTVVLRLSYRTGPTHGTSEGRGETTVAAHAALRSQLVGDRIGLALRALVDANTLR
jgi:hypothetical protein